MASQPITRPNAATYSLDDIVGYVLEGRVRIPDFQRSFRWQWEDVRRLLDSIVRGYPIGSLLLWSRPAGAEELHLGALTIQAPAMEEALWVVDGQQRLTSLANALDRQGSTDTRFATAYDLARKDFIKGVEERPHTIPLPIIFDLQALLRWFAEHEESTEYFDDATHIAKVIRQYAIPAYIVKQQDETILRDIFDRMNNYGKRLTRAEVFSALHASERREGPSRPIPDIVEYIDTRFGFGEIDEDTVLHAVLARRAPNVTRDIRREFSGERGTGESADEAYRGGKEALSRAVAFLQEDAGVPHFGFLSYRYLLVILTRFFAHHPDPAYRNRELLRRWFWRATLMGPESFSGWTQAMRTLATKVTPDAEGQSVQRLLTAVDPDQPIPLKSPVPGKFRSTTASSRIFLCALWHLQPRSVLSGEPYDRALLSQALAGRKTAGDVVYPILPRDPYRARAANRSILLGDDTPESARDLFAGRPGSTPDLFDATTNMPEATWNQVLQSHGLDTTLSAHLVNGRHEEFLGGRETLLTGIIRDFLATMTQSDFEDTPPLDSLDLDDEDDEIRDDASA